MNVVSEYVVVKGILTNEKEIIPVWDERVTFYVKDEEEYGYSEECVMFKGRLYSNFIDCIFNLKTKKVEMGIELNYYPNKETSKYNIGKEILYETGLGNHCLKKSVISNIIFEDYDVHIKKGSEVVEYFGELFEENTLNPNLVYFIKSWKPYYLMEDGTIIKYDFQLYELV